MIRNLFNLGEKNLKNFSKKLTIRADSINRVPPQPGIAKAPINPSNQAPIRPTCRTRPALSLPCTRGLRWRHPQQLHAGLRPPAHGQTRIQIHETPVRPTTLLPDPYPVRRRRPAGTKRAARRAAAPGRRAGGVAVHVAEAGGGAVERGVENGVGAVEVEYGVAAGDVEGGGGVQLEAVGREIGCDAGVGEEG